MDAGSSHFPWAHFSSVVRAAIIDSSKSHAPCPCLPVLQTWYRPELRTSPRPVFAVNLTNQVGGDLGGSVVAGLASAAFLLRSSPVAGDAALAVTFLDKAKEVWEASKLAKHPCTAADFNLTLLYNSSTVYDDLAWGAAWLYKATDDLDYLRQMYDFYELHVHKEGERSDFKAAFDWDNVFFPLNVLMAQEMKEGTFYQHTHDFLYSWVCAGHAANYTDRGRAFNPMSGEPWKPPLLTVPALLCY